MEINKKQGNIYNNTETVNFEFLKKFEEKYENLIEDFLFLSLLS